jgi:Phosphate-starvation-inducible E family
LCSRRPLLLTALATMVSAGRLLWEAVSHATIAAQTLRVLDELLVALMLVEILHTVRISIRSHVLVTEPFLVIGLIASIRRMLGDKPGTGHPHQTKEHGRPRPRAFFALL